MLHPGEGRVQTLRRDGVRLAFDEVGRGEPPLLLVHGWACDHTFFAPQARHFGQRQRVVAVDLRGHGASDRPDQDYAMGELAGDLAWLCAQLGLAKPIVVGHSMGGVLAFELAVRFPDVPSAIIALDAGMVLPPRTLARLRSRGRDLRGAGYREAVRKLVQGMFLPTDDAARRAWIVEKMSGGPPHVLASAWEQLFACPSASVATAGATALPMLAVASAGGHLADLDRLRELCPRLMTGQTVGAGHFHQLEVPDQINAMIERFLAVVVPRPISE
jgi:pimeloyl-ACP methyl ester carboxylesterase